jgi:hypothetical protein
LVQSDRHVRPLRFSDAAKASATTAVFRPALDWLLRSTRLRHVGLSCEERLEHHDTELHCGCWGCQYDIIQGSSNSWLRTRTAVRGTSEDIRSARPDMSRHVNSKHRFFQWGSRLSADAGDWAHASTFLLSSQFATDALSRGKCFQLPSIQLCRDSDHASSQYYTAFK